MYLVFCFFVAYYMNLMSTTKTEKLRVMAQGFYRLALKFKSCLSLRIYP